MEPGAGGEELLHLRSRRLPRAPWRRPCHGTGMSAPGTRGPLPTTPGPLPSGSAPLLYNSGMPWQGSPPARDVPCTSALSPGSPGRPCCSPWLRLSVLVAGLVAAGSGCRHARSSGSPMSDLPGDKRSQAEHRRWVTGMVLGDTEWLSPSPGSGTPAGRSPPVCTLPDLGRPGAELLLVPGLEHDIGGVGDLGGHERGTRRLQREKEICIPLPPTCTWGPTLTPAGAEHPPPECRILPCTLSLVGKRNRNLAREISAATCAPEGGKGLGTGCGPPRPGPTLRTKVWRLSGISRRVHLRTSWMAEQAACSFGLEPCGGEHGG